VVYRIDALQTVPTPHDEYEYDPDGDWRHNPVADRWAMRVGRWIKDTAQHGHVVAVLDCCPAKAMSFFR
jgi:hypothetical protein